MRLLVAAPIGKQFRNNHTHLHNKKTSSGELNWISCNIEIGQKNSLRLNQNIMEISVINFKNDIFVGFRIHTIFLKKNVV